MQKTYNITQIIAEYKKKGIDISYAKISKLREMGLLKPYENVGRPQYTIEAVEHARRQSAIPEPTGKEKKRGTVKLMAPGEAQRRSKEMMDNYYKTRK